MHGFQKGEDSVRMESQLLKLKILFEQKEHKIILEY